MKCYDKLTSAWNLPECFGVGPDFQDGFFAAVALFLVLFFILLLIKRLSHRGRNASGIVVEGNMGELFITSSAVREFVSRVLKEFEDIRLRGLKLYASGRKTALTLEIAVTSNNGLPALRDAVQSRVITELEEKLGLSQPPKVNLKVRSLQHADAPVAKENAINLDADDILEP